MPSGKKVDVDGDKLWEKKFRSKEAEKEMNFSKKFRKTCCEIFVCAFPVKFDRHAHCKQKLRFDFFEESLETFFKKSHKIRITEDLIRNITKQILEAYNCLHKEDYIHGSVKMKNILIYRPKHLEIAVKLSNFTKSFVGNNVSSSVEAQSTTSFCSLGRSNGHHYIIYTSSRRTSMRNSKTSRIC